MSEASVKNNPTYEILGFILTFCGSANETPKLANTFLGAFTDAQPLPRAFRVWSIVIYFVFLLAVASSIYFYRTRPTKTLSREQRAVRAIRRNNLISYWKRFPVSLIADVIFRSYGVWSYDIFNRTTSLWPPRDDFFETIFRFRPEGKTLEFQFPRSFNFIEIRETVPNSQNDSFGTPSRVQWRDLQMKYLVFTTWFGIGWISRYFFKKLTNENTRNKA